MRVRLSHLALTLGAVALVLKSAGPAPTAEPTRDIATTAVEAGNFTTLAKALDAAGLVETLKVDNANVVKTDIVATNSVIHVIDAVILPQ